MATQKLTGRAAFFTISGTKIPFKKFTPKSTRKLVDSTDSLDYDPTSDLIWTEQLAAGMSIEFAVEGWYNLSVTPANVLNLLYTSAAAVPIVVNLNASVILGHGNFDISDFSSDIPVDDMVSFSATFKSNGVWTNGS